MMNTPDTFMRRGAMLALLTLFLAAPAAVAQPSGAPSPIVPKAGQINIKSTDTRPPRVQFYDIVDYCHNGQRDSAARLFAYVGPDISRSGKDVYNYGNPAERTTVDSLCNRVLEYLLGSEGYTVGVPTTETVGSEQYATVVVKIIFKDRLVELPVKFVKINSQYRVVSMG